MDAVKIFWDVDTQVDFMRQEGKLYVPGAESIVPQLQRLTSWGWQHEILVVASACAHQPHDDEFKLYPPHCIVGTEGQKKISETRLAKQAVVPNRPVHLPAGLNGYEQILIEKQHFDVFTNPNTDALLEQLGKPEIVLYGVVTEICVAAAARGFLDRGYRLTVVEDAIRCLDPGKAAAVLEEIRQGEAKSIPQSRCWPRSTGACA